MRYAIVTDGSVSEIVDSNTQPEGARGPIADRVGDGWRYVASSDSFLPPLNYRDRRSEAYRQQLAKTPGDSGNFEYVLGDVLDTLIKQVELMRQSGAFTATEEFGAMLEKIAAVKAEYPRPE